MTVTFYKDVTLDRAHKHVTANVRAYLSHFDSVEVDMPIFSPTDDFYIDSTNFRASDGYNYCTFTVFSHRYYYFVDFVYPYAISTVNIHFMIDDWAMFIGNAISPNVSGTITRASNLLSGVSCKAPIDVLNGSLPYNTVSPAYTERTKYQHLLISCNIIYQQQERVAVFMSTAPFAENTPSATLFELNRWLYEVKFAENVYIYTDDPTSPESYEIKSINGAWAVYGVDVTGENPFRSKFSTSAEATSYLYLRRGYVTFYGVTLTDLVPNERVMIGNRLVNTCIDSTPYSTGASALTVEITQTIQLTESAVTTVVRVGDTTMDVTNSCRIPDNFVATELTKSQRVTRDAINLSTGAISLVGSVAAKNPIGIASSAVQIGSTVADMLTRTTANAISAEGGYYASCYGYFNAYAPDVANEEYLLAPVDFYYLQVLNAPEVNSAIFSEGYILCDNVQSWEFTGQAPENRHRYVKFKDVLVGGIALLYPYCGNCAKYFENGVHIWYDTTTSLVYGNYGVNV